MIGHRFTSFSVVGLWHHLESTFLIMEAYLPRNGLYAKNRCSIPVFTRKFYTFFQSFKFLIKVELRRNAFTLLQRNWIIRQFEKFETPLLLEYKLIKLKYPCNCHSTINTANCYQNLGFSLLITWRKVYSSICPDFLEEP